MSKGTHYEFADMMKYVRLSNLKACYSAGGQIELLEDAFGVEWLLLERDDNCEWYAIFKMKKKIHLLNGYFGSCSGCDDLEEADPVEWLETYVKNVRAFKTLEQAIAWLTTTDDHSYSSVKHHMLGALERVRLGQ